MRSPARQVSAVGAVLTKSAGPESHLYGHITTSCFNDVVLVPLATWIYLLLVAALLILYAGRPAYDAVETKPEGHRPPSRRRRAAELCRKISYGLALFVVFGMSIVEIARLSLAHLGVGLLPFEWVAFGVAGFLYFSRGIRGRFANYWIASEVLWFSLLVMSSVKLAGLVKEGVDTRKGTKYPMSDQVTDVAVLLVVYVVMMGLELWR